MHEITVEEEGAVSVGAVRFEHLREAVGIGTARPRLSWISQTEQTGWRQSAYQVEASSPDGQYHYLTGEIASDQSVLVPWPFAPLASRERRLVRVRVWGDDGRASAWSEFASVEAGLWEPGDWSARFITPDGEGGRGEAQPLPLLRREFNVREGVAQARLYMTALGFRLHEESGMCLITGYPLREREIGPTPSHWKEKPSASPTIEADLFFAGIP